MNPDEPRLGAVKVPAAPAEIPADERPVWARLAKAVDALGVFTVADEVSFALMVSAVAYAIAIAREKDASPNQIVAARNAAFSAMAQFGLTPQSRAKVSRVAKDDEDDDLAEFVQ